MILNCNDKALAHLADGSVHWFDSRFDGWPKGESNIKVDAAIAVKACPSGLHTTLTHDERLLAGMKPEHKLTDITSSLPVEISTLLFDSSTTVHVSDYTITVKTLHDVAFLNVKSSHYNSDVLVVTSSTLYTFPCGINLAGFGSGHGFVRTRNNCLHLVDGDNSRNGKGAVAADIADPENIQEIITASWYTLLIMKDGTVRACGLFDNHIWWQLSKPFTPIEFPEKVSVAKIINIWPHIFFITTEGLCYYIGLEVRPLCVSLVRALTGFYVENVFVTGLCIIVQHSGLSTSKLCCLSVDITRYSISTVERLDKSHIRGTLASRPLPLFDGISIASVQRINEWTYFTTSEGHVYHCRYHCRYWLDCRDDWLEESQFFVDRPVMVANHTARIQSAASALNDA